MDSLRNFPAASPVGPETLAWARAAIPSIRSVVQPAPTGKVAPGKRRLAMVHLDGVPRALLDQAIASGSMPFLSRLIRSGHSRLESAFWGSPASTPCFQAGLLYGLRHPDLPAYKWFDRKLGRLVEMNVPTDCAAIESRLGSGSHDSLLDGGGTSYLSLFRANADNFLSMSSLSQMKRLLRSLWRDLKGTRTTARRNLSRFAGSLIQEVLRTGADGLKWVERVGSSRFEGSFWFNRVFLTSLAWAYAHSRALMDMVRGVPALYLVYGNYDEVAHRRGPRSPQAIQELHRVDGALEELWAVGSQLEPGYDIVILTDHGHVDSTPFERRAGRDLKHFLLEGAPASIAPALQRMLLEGRAPLTQLPPDRIGQPLAVDCGNFAHIYLRPGEKPLEAREILAAGQDVLARAQGSQDIGVVVMRQGAGSVALVKGEPYRVEDLARAPLSAAFSRQAVADLMQELPHMPNGGDLVLFGDATDAAGTVGFAWEFGSHGGVTQVETNSVICWPTSAPLELTGLTHSTQLHQKLSEAYRA